VSSTVAVRRASVDDAVTLSETSSSTFWHAYGHSAPRDDVARHVEEHFSPAAIRGAMQDDVTAYYIAMDGARCSGLVKIRAPSAPPTIDAPDAVEVQQLYVSPDQQRMGTGRNLMKRVVELAAERNAPGIWLTVWSEADWATAFYRRYGFVERGTVPFQLGGTTHTDYVMWLPAGSGHDR
jgi:ribosomal protein S18 acetylase RimI-like enzyme